MATETDAASSIYRCAHCPHDVMYVPELSSWTHIWYGKTQRDEVTHKPMPITREVRDGAVARDKGDASAL